MPKGSMQGRIQVVEQSRCRTHRQQTTTIAETQSPQSVLIGIENSHYLIKNRLFLQAKAEPHGSASVCRKTPIVIKKWVFSVACYVGFASCKTFGKQPKHPCFGAEPPYRSSAICATASCSGFVWLTASILAWTRGGSPSNIAPFRGKGVWG